MPIRRLRRARLAAVALALGSVAVPLGAPAPAGATAAPLSTTDGVGIRVDEAAVSSAMVEAMEDAVQDVYDLAIDDYLTNQPPPIPPPNTVTFDGDVELALDFLAPAGSRPSGALALHADVQGMAVHYYRQGEWWQPECWIDFEGDDATVDAEVRPHAPALPAAPFASQPVGATWDDDPDVAVNQWLCNGYLIDEWWEWWTAMVDTSDPASVASQVGAAVDAILADLAADAWTGNVAPVFASVDAVSGFAVAVNQLRFDDHGLVSTATVDASGGFTFPGSGSTYYVAGAQDAGVTSNVNTLLAARTVGGQASEVTVSIHPNLFNQHLEAVNSLLGGTLSDEPIGSGIELVLLELADRGSYANSQWTARLRAGSAPRLHPSAPGGAPVLEVPGAVLELRNPSLVPADPRVTTFAGTMDDGELVTVASPCCTPAIDVGPLTWPATRTQADAAAASTSPAPVAADLLPWARDALQAFLDQHVDPLADISVDGFPGHGATLCTTCGHHTGDERYTETFHVA